LWKEMSQTDIDLVIIRRNFDGVWRDLKKQSDGICIEAQGNWWRRNTEKCGNKVWNSASKPRPRKSDSTFRLLLIFLSNLCAGYSVGPFAWESGSSQCLCTSILRARFEPAAPAFKRAETVLDFDGDTCDWNDFCRRKRFSCLCASASRREGYISTLC